MNPSPIATPTTGEPAEGTSLARIVAGLVLVGISLRPQILMIGPLLPAIQGELGVTHAVAGLLGTIPVLCMGILAPLGPVLAASIGPRLGGALCVLAIGGFGIVRVLLPGTEGILLATVGIGAGMALIGPILPMVIRSRAPGHPAAGTGAYVVGMIVGGSVATALAVPLADAFGGWRPAIGIVSAAAVVSLIAWWLLIPRDHGVRRSAPRRPSLPWRRPTAWLIGLVFASQSMLFYGCISWLASAYIERGWTTGQAAALITFFNSIGLLAALTVPFVGDRVGTRRTQLFGSSLLAVTGMVIMTLTPGEPGGSALSFGAAAILALGIGAFFPLVLTLPVDVADGPADAASISAFMLLIGYLISSLSPVVLGLVRDATGGFGAVLWLMVGMAVTMIPLSLSLGEGRLRRAGAQ